MAAWYYLYVAHSGLGNSEEVENCIQKLNLSIQNVKSVYIPSRLDRERMAFNVGRICIVLNKYDQALLEFKEYLAYVEKRDRPPGDATITALSYIKTCLTHLGLFFEALAVAHDACQIEKKKDMFVPYRELSSSSALASALLDSFTKK